MFQAEEGIRDRGRSGGLGGVNKRQLDSVRESLDSVKETLGSVADNIADIAP